MVIPNPPSKGPVTKARSGKRAPPRLHSPGFGAPLPGGVFHHPITSLAASAGCDGIASRRLFVFPGSHGAIRDPVPGRTSGGQNRVGGGDSRRRTRQRPVRRTRGRATVRGGEGGLAGRRAATARHGRGALREAGGASPGLVLSLSVGGSIRPDRGAGRDAVDDRRHARQGSPRQYAGRRPDACESAGRFLAARSAGLRDDFAGVLRRVLRPVHTV